MGQAGCGSFSKGGDWQWFWASGGAAGMEIVQLPALPPPAGGGRGRASPHALSPPGLAVDYHNERLYWADAKLSVIGSIRLNGTDPIVAADSKRGQP